MGRKFNLIKESDKVLHMIRSGSSATKLKRKREVRQSINDLIRIGKAPTQLSNLTQNHIEELINHWKSRSLSKITIANKLSVLRKFFKIAAPNLTLPSNKELKVHSNNKKKPDSPTENLEHILNVIETKTTRSVIAFQLYFGLTKMESIRINISHANHEKYLLIDRSLATNRKDRYIPIATLQQQKAIEDRIDLLTGNETITDILPEISATALYKAEMLINGLSNSINFRRYYAVNRLNILLQQNSKNKALEKLQSELGVRSKYQLKTLL